MAELGELAALTLASEVEHAGRREPRPGREPASDLDALARLLTQFDLGPDECVRLARDLFVAFWEEQALLDPALPVAPLLYRMARYRALNHLRDRRLRDAKHDVLRREAAEGEEPADGLDAAALSVRLQRWTAALPER